MKIFAPLACLLAVICTLAGFVVNSVSFAAGLFLTGAGCIALCIKIAQLDDEERRRK